MGVLKKIKKEHPSVDQTQLEKTGTKKRRVSTQQSSPPLPPSSSHFLHWELHDEDYILKLWSTSWGLRGVLCALVTSCAHGAPRGEFIWQWGSQWIPFNYIMFFILIFYYCVYNFLLFDFNQSVLLQWKYYEIHIWGLHLFLFQSSYKCVSMDLFLNKDTSE